MEPNKYIKIAGLASKWDIQYGVRYKAVLIDMGYEVRLLETDYGIFVAYCPVPFSKTEAVEVIKRIFTKDGE